MLRYLRSLKPLITSKSTETFSLAEDLTDEQRKKYRNQYIWTLVSALALSAVYIAAVIFSIEAVFIADGSGVFFFIALTLMFMRDYFRMLEEWKEAIELIEERIMKRTKKNIKQGRVQP